MKRILFVTLLLMLISVPSRAERLCVEYNPAGDMLCSIQGDSGPNWYVFTGCEDVLTVAPLPTERLISQMSASASGTFVAILSVGEGHPLLQVYSTERLDYGETPDVLATFNPYPGSVSLGAWRGDTLLFVSDMPLDRERESRPAEPLPAAEQFRYDASANNLVREQ